ncbi:hypothetical protein Plhal703r1_c18g0082551 [Plasmopara halstedii]
MTSPSCKLMNMTLGNSHSISERSLAGGNLQHRTKDPPHGSDDSAALSLRGNDELTTSSSGSTQTLSQRR